MFTIVLLLPLPAMATCPAHQSMFTFCTYFKDVKTTPKYCTHFEYVKSAPICCRVKTVEDLQDCKRFLTCDIVGMNFAYCTYFQ